MFGKSKYKLSHLSGYNFLQIEGNGSHSKKIVLIHGMFGGLSNFDAFIEQLEGYSIFVPDIPLYELKKSMLSIPGLAQWLDDFISTVGIKNPILLGNSIGGHIALEYARAHPHKPHALILTGSSGLLEYDFGSSFPKRRSRKYLRERANMTFYDDLANEVIVDEILDVVNSRQKSLSLLKLTRSTHSHNMEEMLPSIMQPTLLIWGKQDVVTPPKVAREFEKLLPNVQLRWIDQCGHAPMMERPAQFTKIVNQFLQHLEQKDENKKSIL